MPLTIGFIEMHTKLTVPCEHSELGKLVVIAQFGIVPEPNGVYYAECFAIESIYLAHDFEYDIMISPCEWLPYADDLAEIVEQETNRLLKRAFPNNVRNQVDEYLCANWEG